MVCPEAPIRKRVGRRRRVVKRRSGVGIIKRRTTIVMVGITIIRRRSGKYNYLDVRCHGG